MKKLVAFLENALLIARKPVPVFVRVPAWGRTHHIEHYQRGYGNFRREWDTPQSPFLKWE